MNKIRVYILSTTAIFFVYKNQKNKKTRSKKEYKIQPTNKKNSLQKQKFNTFIDFQ